VADTDKAGRDEAWRPQEMPALLIHRLARVLAKLDDERLRHLGISVAQLPVIVALKNGECRTQKELAVITGVEQPSMAQLLARMERDGMVHRQPDPTDGRSSLISLTDKALSRLEPGRDVLRRTNREALAELTPEEVKSVTSLLRRILATLERRQESCPSEGPENPRDPRTSS
jgi:MarR family transcriptional regulator, transcriptional regulator for hemolysin